MGCFNGLCIYQHIGNFARDFEISPLYNVRFSTVFNVMMHNSQSNIFICHHSKTETFHREKLTGHTAAILEDISAMIFDSPLFLETSKSQKSALLYRIVWPGLFFYLPPSQKKTLEKHINDFT